jgi:hypothetical protein
MVTRSRRGSGRGFHRSGAAGGAEGPERVDLGVRCLEKRARAARSARNPRTGEAVKVKKTKVPAFRPGRYFRDVIAGTVKLPKPSLTPLPARAAAAAARAAAASRAAAGGAVRKTTTGTAAGTAGDPGGGHEVADHPRVAVGRGQDAGGVEGRLPVGKVDGIGGRDHGGRCRSGRPGQGTDPPRGSHGRVSDLIGRVAAPVAVAVGGDMPTPAALRMVSAPPYPTTVGSVRHDRSAGLLDVPPNDDHGPGSRHPRCRRAAGTQVDARHRQHDDEAGQPRAAPAVGRPVVVRVTVRDRFVVTVTMRVERRSGATRTDHFRSAVW